MRLGVTLALCCAFGLAFGHQAADAEHALLSSEARRGRRLSAASTKCVWVSSSSKCYLNADYITSLPGSPITDSQKVLARAAALDYNCSTITNQTKCLANLWPRCAWESSACGLAADLDPTWLRNIVYCPGSPADAAVTCVLATSQGACDTKLCDWQTFSQYSVAGLASQFMGLVGDWAGVSSSSFAATGGVCTPKWLSDANFIPNLVNKIINAGFNSSSSGGGVFASIFTDLFGSCAGVDKYKTLLSNCTKFSNKTTCLGLNGCGWTPPLFTGLNGRCDIAQDFGSKLLLNQTDPWVVSYQTAVSTCANFTTATTCAASASITVDTAKYVSYSQVTPFPTSSPGAASVVRGSWSAVLLSAMAALAAVLGVMML